MSDQTDNQTPESGETDTGNGAQNWRRQVESERDAATAAKTAAEEQLAELQRKLAVKEAGLDESNPTHKLFIDNYKGEATKDAVLAAAAPYALIQEPANPAQQNIDANARIDSAGFNAEPAATDTEQQKVINDIIANSAGGFDWDAAAAAGLVANG